MSRRDPLTKINFFARTCVRPLKEHDHDRTSTLRLVHRQ
jgi:hypothetical protein